jgi:membrane associated rhomboid family serine protease
VSEDHAPAWRRWPPVVLALAGALVVAYALFSVLSESAQNEVFYAFALIPARFDSHSQYAFQSWYEAVGPLFGHAFLHGGWFHLGMNTLVFLQAAPFLANRLGATRFLVLFLVSTLGGAFAYILINPHSELPMVGASGAICGVFAAYFLAVRPTPQEALADPRIRSAIGWFLLINVALMGVLSAAHVLPIAWEAHLGGFASGGLAYLALAPRQRVAGPWG